MIKSGKLAVVAAAIAVASAVGIPDAAASGTTHMNTTTMLRACTDVNNSICNTRYWVTAGTAVQMKCWEDANWYDGTNRWFIVWAPSVGAMGWVSANMVSNQTVVGHC
jgi:hypothetical protein